MLNILLNLAMSFFSWKFDYSKSISIHFILNDILRPACRTSKIYICMVMLPVIWVHWKFLFIGTLKNNKHCVWKLCTLLNSSANVVYILLYSFHTSKHLNCLKLFPAVKSSDWLLYLPITIPCSFLINWDWLLILLK